MSINNNEEKKTTCPLCGSELNYRIENKTHLWSCSMCPFMGLEVYSVDDIEELKNSFLKHNIF
jgi:ribosomal protein L37AE/L43A